MADEIELAVATTSSTCELRANAGIPLILIFYSIRAGLEGSAKVSKVPDRAPSHVKGALQISWHQWWRRVAPWRIGLQTRPCIWLLREKPLG